MATDLSSHYVLLDASGAASTVNGGDAFWSQAPEDLDRYGRGWLVSEYTFAADWPQPVACCTSPWARARSTGRCSVSRARWRSAFA